MDQSQCQHIPVHLNSDITADAIPGYIYYFAATAIGGLLMNFLVLSIWAFNKKLRSKPFMFLISVSAGDALLPLYGALKFLDPRFRFDDANKALPLEYYKWSCFLSNHLEVTIQSTLVLSLIAVSMERYIVICKPLKAKYIWTRKRCRYVILVIWLISFCMGFLKTTNLNTKCHIMCHTNGRELLVVTCEYSSRYTVAVFRFVSLFGLPFICMLVTYGQVIYTLWHSSSTQLNLTQASTRRGILKQMRERRLPLQSTASTMTTSSTFDGSFTDSFASKSVEETSNTDCRKTSLTEPHSSSFSTTMTPGPIAGKKQQIVAEICSGRKKLIRMLILVMLLFFLCYGPDVCVELLITQATSGFQETMKSSSSANDSTVFGATASSNCSVALELMEIWEMLEQSYHNGTLSEEVAEKQSDSLETLALFQHYARFLMLAHSTFNPFVYLLFSKDFRLIFVKFKRKVLSYLHSLNFNQ